MFRRATNIMMAFILLLSTIFGNVFFVSASTDVDVTGPELKFDTLQINQKEAKPGDTVKISFEATDDSAIKSVYVYYLTPITGRKEYVSITYNESTGKYEGSLPIKETTEPGEWEIYSISLVDEWKNGTHMFHNKYDFSAIQFVVNNDNEVDVTGPELKFDTLQINQKEAKPGDTVKISFEATDDSAIKSVDVYYLTPITGRNEYVSVTYNDSTGKYEGSLPIKETTELGEWEIYSISLVDEWKNSTSMFRSEYDFSAIQFVVNNDNEVDVTGPELKFNTLQINQKEAKPGDTVKISFEATDESAIKSVYVYYLKPITGRIEYVSITYNDSTGKYEGSLPIKETTEPGEWELYSISLVDEWKNSTNMFYSKYDFTDLAFTVIEDKATMNKYFTDVPVNHTFYSDIHYLVNKSIVLGYPDGTFRPGKSVSRGEAAIMIGRALGLDGTQQNTSFSDVGSSSVASGYIQSAVKAGIIQGYPDGTYRPNEPVTRGQMAILLARALKLTETTNVTFADVSKNMVAYDYIGKIVVAKITVGYEDNTYRPNEVCTRGQFSAFLTRGLKFIEK